MTQLNTVITCKAGQYTALSSASETNVSFRILRMIGTTIGRLASGASQPAATSTDFNHISDRHWKEFGVLTTNLWFMPITSDADVEVMKG